MPACFAAASSCAACSFIDAASSVPVPGLLICAVACSRSAICASVDTVFTSAAMRSRAASGRPLERAGDDPHEAVEVELIEAELGHGRHVEAGRAAAIGNSGQFDASGLCLAAHDGVSGAVDLYAVLQEAAKMTSVLVVAVAKFQLSGCALMRATRSFSEFTPNAGATATVTTVLE